MADHTADLLAADTGWQVAVEASTAASSQQMSDMVSQNQELVAELLEAGTAQTAQEQQLRVLRQGMEDQAAAAQLVKEEQLRELRKQMQEEAAAALEAKEEQIREMHNKMQDAAESS